MARLSRTTAPCHMPMANTIVIVQANLGRAVAASNTLLTYCVRENVDVALIQEPYVRQGRVYILGDPPIRCVSHRAPGENTWAAIVVFNPKLDVLVRHDLTNQHFAVSVVNLPGQAPITLVSEYYQFRIPNTQFIQHTKHIHNSTSQRRLFALDENGYHTAWHFWATNPRGLAVIDMIDELGLDIVNRSGQDPTFNGPMELSSVDIMLVDQWLKSAVRDWKCTRRVIGSDHSLIAFAVEKGFTTPEPQIRVRYRDDKIKDNFPSLILDERESANYSDIVPPEVRATIITRAITKVCDEQLRNKEVVIKRIPPPWWTKEVLAARRVAANATRKRYSDPS